MITTRPAVPADVPRIESLLREAGLDAEGVSERLDSTVVACDGGVVVGTAAAERAAADVLLRSFAVDAARRGHGIGQALAIALLDAPVCRRARDAYLLTETAAAFFSRLGFAPASRAEAPAAIAASDQFARLCPSSATFMRRALRAADPAP